MAIKENNKGEKWNSCLKKNHTKIGCSLCYPGHNPWFPHYFHVFSLHTCLGVAFLLDSSVSPNYRLTRTLNSCSADLFCVFISHFSMFAENNLPVPIPGGIIEFASHKFLGKDFFGFQKPVIFSKIVILVCFWSTLYGPYGEAYNELGETFLFFFNYKQFVKFCVTKSFGLTIY